MNMIYASLAHQTNQHHRILGFDEYSDHNMHIYFFGIKKKTATIVGEFPQKIIYTSHIPMVLAQYTWQELIPVNKELAYFSLHPQDMVFRLQYKDGSHDHVARADRSIYETGRTIFQMNVQTDNLNEYEATVSRFKYKKFSIGVEESCPYLEFMTYISKNEGEALTQVAANPLLHPLKRDVLVSKGQTITTATDFRVNDRMSGVRLPDRPRGTFVVMFFRTDFNQYITKAFLIA